MTSQNHRSPLISAALLSLGALSIGATAAHAGDAYPVVAVPAPDRVVVLTRNFPVVLGLAHIAIPDDDTSRAAIQAKLGELMKGKKTEILYSASFGTDSAGAAKVQFVVAGTNINAELVAAGLARFEEGAKADPALEKPVRDAEAKAQKNKAGLWAKGPKTAPEAPKSVVAVQKKGPFCSELDTPFYFASDSDEAAKFNPQRVIYYPDEATAQRAGKKLKAKVEDAEITSDGSEASADAIFEKGKTAYNTAIDKGNSSERDTAYEAAYQYLTKAMQVYSALCEKKPNDEALGEKLRKCMQLRYGTVKQRRFH